MTTQFIAALEKREEAQRKAMEVKATQLQSMEKDKASTAELNKVRADLVAMGTELKELKAEITAGVDDAVEAAQAQHLESLKAQHREDFAVIKEVVTIAADGNAASHGLVKETVGELKNVFKEEMAEQRQLFTQVLGTVLDRQDQSMLRQERFLTNLAGNSDQAIGSFNQALQSYTGASLKV
jgi:N-acetylglucosamine kinase-like BadF-type ATPase